MAVVRLPPLKMAGEWKEGVFNCFEDTGICESLFEFLDMNFLKTFIVSQIFNMTQYFNLILQLATST